MRHASDRGAQGVQKPYPHELRSWSVKDFEDILIFYTVHPKALRIVRVLHGKRDIKKILERERDEETPG